MLWLQMAVGLAHRHRSGLSGSAGDPYPCVVLASITVQASDFRTFWGEKSELRRFQDGSICEAVVWEAKTICQKRLIPEQIVKHLLKL